MRLYFTVLVVIAVTAGSMPSPAQAGFGFRLNGGIAYVTYSDFNDYADFMNERELPAMGVTEKIDNIHWVPEVNGEFLISPFPSLTIGVGAGMITGTSTFSFAVGSEGLSYEHTVKAYPLGATGYFNIPMPGAPIKPYLHGGFAAVYSKIAFDVKLTAGGVTGGLDAELTTWGFAVHGGGGVMFTLFPNVSIDLGFKGRWANLTGYEGTGTFLGEGSFDVFLAKEHTPEHILYGPEKVERRDLYEEASVDLSGFAVTLGVTVSF
jgi:opacity protein-like surface antigen